MVFVPILITLGIFLPALLPAIFIRESNIRALGSGYVTHVFRGSSNNATMTTIGSNKHISLSNIDRNICDRYRVDIGDVRPIVSSVAYSAEGFSKTMIENNNKVETCRSFDDELDMKHPKIWMLGEHCSTDRHKLLRSQKRMVFWTTLVCEFVILICYCLAACSVKD